MFHDLEMAPRDPILGLTEAFVSDPNPQKINLSVGVYQDADGRTPVLESVRRAAVEVLGEQSTAEYLPITGDSQFGRAVQQLVFDGDHRLTTSDRLATSHTPGGTGALRVAADFLRKVYPEKRVWVSRPTWPNHANVFGAAGLRVEPYSYFDSATNDLDFEAMLTDLKKIPPGDVLLLHGCCHNPTGVDPTVEQWNRIAEVAEQRGLLPLLDFAYQGLADGLHQDAEGLRTLCRAGGELLVCTSFSKNFGLYRQRTGALTVIAADADGAQKSLSHIKKCIRANYSNPPAFGAAVVKKILTTEALRTVWHEELVAMRDRINQMRTQFVQGLADAGASHDFSFLARQRGMFSFSGLSRGQVQRLRDEHSIYIVDSGRINVAGMTQINLPRLCAAIVGVL